MPSLRDLLPGAAEGFLSVAQERQRRQQELQHQVALAEAEQQMKQRYDPEAILKHRLLNIASRIGAVPRPSGGFSPLERARGLPEQVEQAAAERGLAALQRLLPRSAGVPIAPYVLDPSTGVVTPATLEGGHAAVLQPGSRVFSRPLTPEAFGAREQARQETRAETLPLRVQEAAQIARAKVEAAPGPERIQAASAIDSMLQSLDDMERMLTERPERLLTSQIPFLEREFAAVRDQFDKEAAIASGGKQLTATELNLIRRTRPTLQDLFSPGAIAIKINKLRQIGQNAKARFEGRMSPSGPSFSSTSAPQGQPRLMRDRHGNEAYVYSDGRVEEIP